jgi:hypothetical protein
MLELAILLLFVTIVFAALGGLGFFAVLAAGVAMMLALIFFDWLRHKLVPVRVWLERHHGERLRALHRARANLLLSVSLCAFLGWLAWLWWALPVD